jgi:hypothetical protein
VLGRNLVRIIANVSVASGHLTTILESASVPLCINLYSSCVLPSRTAFNLYRTKVTFAVTQVKV